MMIERVLLLFVMILGCVGCINSSSLPQTESDYIRYYRSLLDSSSVSQQEKLSLTRKDCIQNTPIACYFRGRLLLENEQVGKGNKIISDACRNNVAIACNHLATQYEQNQQETLALEYYKKACDLNYDYACYSYGNIALILGLKNFESKTANVKLKDFNFDEEIRRFQKERKTTKEYEDCFKQQNINNCYQYGKLFLEEERLLWARYFFLYACKYDHRESCYHLATLYHDMGNSIQADKSFKKACDLDEPLACRQLGIIGEMLDNKENSITFFKKACKLKDSVSCHILSQFKINQ